jgi:hypothetical protein
VGRKWLTGYGNQLANILIWQKKPKKPRDEEFYWQILEATGNLHIIAGDGSWGRNVGRSSDGFPITCKFWRFGTKNIAAAIATAD